MGVKILLVTATSSEIEPFSALFNSQSPTIKFEDFEITSLNTGVGMVATAFSLGNHLATARYDLAINAGIAGSFDFNLNIGEVVQVTEDVFAEQGAEDGEGFISIKELGYGENIQFALNVNEQNTEIDLPLLRSNALLKIKKVKAITVNRVHGNELSIAKTLSRFSAQIESMEGAAFFYACNKSKTPCLQIRSISNYVERRNKENWNIGLAVKNLNDFLRDFLLTNKYES
ncbi:MAG: futalosine hydrolase [Flavobacterium sp.]|nr:futalosine hydrolase [Pedobacter sp.]